MGDGSMDDREELQWIVDVLGIFGISAEDVELIWRENW